MYSDEVLYVEEVNIYGNTNFSYSELYSILKLKNPNFFIRSEFSKKMLNKDLQNIKGFYKTNGFQDIEISVSYKRTNNN